MTVHQHAAHNWNGLRPVNLTYELLKFGLKQDLVYNLIRALLMPEIKCVALVKQLKLGIDLEQPQDRSLHWALC